MGVRQRLRLESLLSSLKSSQVLKIRVSEKHTTVKDIVCCHDLVQLGGSVQDFHGYLLPITGLQLLLDSPKFMALNLAWPYISPVSPENLFIQIYPVWQAGFELRSLGQQAVMLPIDPTLLV